MAEARDRRVSSEDIAEVYRRRRRSILGNEVLESTPRAALRRRFGVEGLGIRRWVNGSPKHLRGRSENVFPLGRRGRASRSVLPCWYPRRPLQDITSVVRAIERRRALVGEDEGQSSQSPISASTAHFVQDISMITPKPTSSRKPFPLTALEVPKILLDITNKNKEESESLTPQKKLLNSIDRVEKVVMEELNKLKQTPTARKAEREKRVRTLMSMR